VSAARDPLGVKRLLLPGLVVRPFITDDRTTTQIQEKERRVACWQPTLLALCFFGMSMLQVLKSLFDCGSAVYWVLTAAVLLWCVLRLPRQASSIHAVCSPLDEFTDPTRLTNHSLNHSLDQSINQSINQSIDQLIN